MQKKLVFLFLVASLFSFSYFVYSDHPPGSNVTFPKDQIERDLALIRKASLYNFDIAFLSDEIEANAGENVSLNVSVINRGSYALREFNLTLSGIDYTYHITPNRTDILVWGEWNPINGLMRGQQNFQINISIPSNAIGVYKVDVTGTEYFSWRKFSNMRPFILKIIPKVSLEPNITISKISYPEDVKEYIPFDINFSVNNRNSFKQQIDLQLNIPSNWTALETKKSVIVEANGIANVTFVIIPANTTGNISVDVVYPFKKNVFSLTKEDSTLVPVAEKPKEIIVQPGIFDSFAQFLSNAGTIGIAILVMIAIIVIWFLLKLIRFYSTRKKPEA